MSLTNTQIGLVILVVVVVGYLIYSAKCSDNFSNISEAVKGIHSDVKLAQTGIYNFVGCFKDSNDRTIKQNLGRMTREKCESEARKLNKLFYGFQDSYMKDNGVEGECWVSDGKNANDDRSLIKGAFRLGKSDPKNCYISVIEKSEYPYTEAKLIDSSNNNNLKGNKLLSGTINISKIGYSVGGPWVNSVYTVIPGNELLLPPQPPSTQQPPSKQPPSKQQGPIMIGSMRIN